MAQKIDKPLNPALRKTAVMRGAFPDWSDEKLKERLSELENEKEAIEFSIRRIENEIFYREHPECVG
jgi:hypothetical protein